MADDDIDIEEHDVLDNPVIRSIFPDISVIKKEISQYYEDVPDIKQEPELNTAYNKPSTNQILPSNADECSKNVQQEYPQKLNSSEDKAQPLKPLQSNKIILGSKPNNKVKQTQHETINISNERKMETVVRLPKIVLQDLGAYIYRNNRYCKDCQTLFPSRIDFDDHKRKLHYMKIRNKQLNVIVTLEKTSWEQNRNKTPTTTKCNICGSHFSCRSNLSRHYKNIHKKKISFKSKYKSNSTVNRAIKLSRVASLNKMTRSQRNNSDKNNVCFHCKKPFPDQKTLIEHIYNVLEPKRYPKKKLSKKNITNKKEYEKTIEWPKVKQTNLNIQENQDSSAFKSSREKLIFENQEDYANEAQSLEIEEKSKNKNSQKKTSNISTAHQLKTEETNTKITKNENENLDPCSSKILRNKRKHSRGSPSIKKKQKLQVQHMNLSKNISQSSKQNNRNPDSHGPKELKSKSKIKDQDLLAGKHKQAKIKKELLSVASNNEFDNNEEFQSEETKVNNMKQRFVYECIYCTYIVPTVRAYYLHVVVKHKVEKILRANKVLFDEHCKYCPSKCKHESGRNSHLYSCHYDLVYKQFPDEVSEQKSTRLKNPAFKMFETFVLESIIYKCNKCDIHFLSSCIAKDHDKHMELLVNWKCSICRRIFKKHDKHLHLKQHKFSKSLNVCEFNESELSRLLYNCTKCAIHFTEERYLKHYPKCDEETTDSVYCKNCDILIDKGGYEIHETYHGKGNNTNSDFTVIVADIIEVTKSKDIEVDRKRKRRYEQVNCLTFCTTCKCYLSDMGLNRKTHIESCCSEIPKYTCNLCGLVLTNKAIGTHRDHHKKTNDLKLQDYKFFDLKGIQINPPIPEYPHCDNCEVHFVSRNAVNNHMCSEIEYLTCPNCNIKLSENAFKLHMNFHSYSLLNVNKDASPVVVTSEPQENGIEQDNTPKITNLCSNTLIKCEQNGVAVSDNSRIIVYSCQSCKIAVDAYDKVVKHCQNHFSPTPRLSTTLKICSKCSLKFESVEYENHQKLHLSYDIIKYLTFDPTFFTSDNKTWLQHIFASEPQSVQKEIVGESIYKHECRIKMEVVQKGPSFLTVYKCDKCGNFIDPDCLFAHIKNECPKNVKKHPCPLCGLPFMSSGFRNKHEIIHRRYDSIRLKSYNIVLFNREAHNTYNTYIIKAIKQYVLYQCRTCDGVVDKLQRIMHQCNTDDLRKCLMCSLLIHKDDFNRHISKHSDLVSFNTRNMKVVLFGNEDKSNEKKTKVLSPSFSGVTLDYTLYKCAKCELCVNNKISISKHICRFDDSKWKCPKCGFYVCVGRSLKQHIEMHDGDSEFITENIKVINFDLSISNGNNLDQTKLEMLSVLDVNDNTNKREQKSINNPDCKQTNPSDNSVKIYNVDEPENVTLYKCACELHFMNELNAKQHVNSCSIKSKVTRQSCSKCRLLFNPKELFSHLIELHGDKNKTYKYKIIEISSDNEGTL